MRKLLRRIVFTGESPFLSFFCLFQNWIQTDVFVQFWKQRISSLDLLDPRNIRQPGQQISLFDGYITLSRKPRVCYFLRDRSNSEDTFDDEFDRFVCGVLGQCSFYDLCGVAC